jgi:hypothetical protein
MNTFEQTKHDVSEVLTCVDYDFDQSKRHEETLEAYNRVRPLLAAAPELLEAAADLLSARDRTNQSLRDALRRAVLKAGGTIYSKS